MFEFVGYLFTSGLYAVEAGGIYVNSTGRVAALKFFNDKWSLMYSDTQSLIPEFYLLQF